MSLGVVVKYIKPGMIFINSPNENDCALREKVLQGHPTFPAILFGYRDHKPLVNVY